MHYTKLARFAFAAALAFCAALYTLPLRADGGQRISQHGKGTASVLVANSRGNNILRYDQHAGHFLGELVPAGAGGLFHPDTMIIGPDGRLFVSSGETLADSAILRFDACSGAFAGVFASGNGLRRPYGMAAGPDGKIYVASFLSDQILRFNATTGAFIDVFAAGNGQPGGLNGPNSLLFDEHGALYVSTEGSIAVDGVATFPGLPSQILKFDIRTGTSSVFADQPPPSAEGFGFVSLLGLAFGPNCERSRSGNRLGHCDLFVSDFAGDVRRYNGEGQIVQVLSTNYTGTIPSQNFVGGLSFGKRNLFVAAFNNALDGNPGAVLRYDGHSGVPLAAPGQNGAVFAPQNAALARPIGILALNEGCKRW
jgi:DNA-binding beta-propeller fold protein YncE